MTSMQNQDLRFKLSQTAKDNHDVQLMNSEITEYNKRAYSVHLITRTMVVRLREMLKEQVNENDKVNK